MVLEPTSQQVSGTVAVVDDDPRLRDLLEGELVDLGVDPFLCSSGLDLIELLKITSVDLILLDLMMPVMDGFACLQELRERQFEGTVVVVTAHGDSSYRKRVIEAGASDYLLKPDLFEALPNLLNQYLK
jgi:DNA-binding response OmpR family regulator